MTLICLFLQDADSNNAYYEFVVTAKDRGEPPRTGTATVRIYTENKNDEEPKFSQQVYTPNVDENAGPNTLVTTVVASDKDGDGVTFGFVGGSTTSGLFRIEENTGVIRLIPGKKFENFSKYWNIFLSQMLKNYHNDSHIQG